MDQAATALDGYIQDMFIKLCAYGGLKTMILDA